MWRFKLTYLYCRGWNCFVLFINYEICPIIYFNSNLHTAPSVSATSKFLIEFRDSALALHLTISYTRPLYEHNCVCKKINIYILIYIKSNYSEKITNSFVSHFISMSSLFLNTYFFFFLVSKE